MIGVGAETIEIGAADRAVVLAVGEGVELLKEVVDFRQTIRLPRFEQVGGLA